MIEVRNMELSKNKAIAIGLAAALCVFVAILIVGRDKSLIEIGDRYDSAVMTDAGSYVGGSVDNAPRIRIRADNGTIQTASPKSPQAGSFLMSVTSNPNVRELNVRYDTGTVIVDSMGKTITTPEILEKGENITVYHDISLPRTTPPDVYAYAIIANKSPEEQNALYLEVLKKTPNEDGSVILTPVNNDIILTIPSDATIISPSGKTLRDIDVEQRVVYFLDNLILGTPLRGTASYILLPD